MIEALKATGVFRSFVPQRFGGYEIGLDLFVDIGVAVSEACPSTGWITTFYMEHNWLLGLFSRRAAGGVFGDAPYILAPGSVNPRSGEAIPKGDGYELTGHWKFATGIVHADWVLLSAMVPAETDAAAAVVPGASGRRRSARHVARRRHDRDRQPRHRREQTLRAGTQHVVAHAARRSPPVRMRRI